MAPRRVRIVEACGAFPDETGSTRVIGLDEIRTKGGNLSIPLYVPTPLVAVLRFPAGSTGDAPR